MSNYLDIRDGLRDDERRRRDEGRLSALQEQIEELRLALQESNSRHAKAEEGRKALEAAIARVEARLAAARVEAQGATDALHLDATRVKQTIEELDARIGQLTTPIPTLQAQVVEVANQVRTKFQELQRDEHRFDELGARIDRLPPLIDRAAEIARGVRDQLEAVRGEIREVEGAAQRVADVVGIVEQDARRRVGDVFARVDETNARIDALRDELPPLDVQIDRVRHELHQALPRFDQLAAADATLREEVERDAALNFDRHTQALARFDEVRDTIEERVRVVERLNDTRFGATMTRFTELEEADRALAGRITLLAVRLDELREQDTTIRLEMQRLEELRVRLRLEQAQQEAATLTERLARMRADLAAQDDDE